MEWLIMLDSKQAHQDASITDVADDAEFGGVNLTVKGPAGETDSDRSSLSETDDQEQSNVGEGGRSATWPGNHHQYPDGNMSNQSRAQSPAAPNERQLSNGMTYYESSGRAMLNEAASNLSSKERTPGSVAARWWGRNKKM